VNGFVKISLTTQNCNIRMGISKNKLKICDVFYVMPQYGNIVTVCTLPEPMSTNGSKTLKVKKIIKRPKCRW